MFVWAHQLERSKVCPLTLTTFGHEGEGVAGPVHLKPNGVYVSL